MALSCRHTKGLIGLLPDQQQLHLLFQGLGRLDHDMAGAAPDLIAHVQQNLKDLIEVGPEFTIVLSSGRCTVGVGVMAEMVYYSSLPQIESERPKRRTK